MKFKTKLGAFLLASSLLFGGALLGCNKSSGGTPKPPKPDYYLTVPTNDEYSITGVQDGQAFKEGDRVEFTVTMEHPRDFALDNVLYNGTECDQVGTSGDSFGFTMPADDVILRVNYHEIEKYTLQVAPSPIVVGLTSTATLRFGDGNYTGDYEVTPIAAGGTGVVSVDGTAVTGVTAGTVYLQAVVDGVDVLEEALEVTVRDPEKGETIDYPLTATEAYVAIQDNRTTWTDGQSPTQVYVRGIIAEFTDNNPDPDTGFDRVTLKLHCKNKDGVDKKLTVYRALCARGTEDRAKLDIGSEITVYANLKAQGTTYETSWGDIVKVNNAVDPVGFMADSESVLLRSIGATFNLNARIAPKGCSEEVVSYVSADPAVATVNSQTGVVTAVNFGSTTVTASVNGYDDLVIPVAVVELEHAGTEDDPLSVEEACLIALAQPEGGITTEQFYLQGIVCGQITHWEPKEDGSGYFQSSSFDLVGSTGEKFICYRVTTTEEQDQALVKGALVKVKCMLQNFYGKAENKSGSVVSLDASTFRLIEFSQSKIEVSMEDEDLEISTLVGTYPEGKTHDEIVYTSGDTDVFTVVEGKIHPVAEGKATLTAACGTVTATAEVTVTKLHAFVIATELQAGEDYVLATPLQSGKVYSTNHMADEPAQFYIAGTTDLLDAATARVTVGEEADYKYTITLTKGETVKTLGVTSNGEGNNKHYNLGFVGDNVPGTEIPYAEAKFKLTDDYHLEVVCDDKTLLVGTQNNKETISLGDTTKVVPAYLYKVVEPIEADSVTVSPKTATVAPGATTRLTATLDPANSSDTVVWSSGDEEVATVDPVTGVVTGVAHGTVTITATAHEGVTDTCVVTVEGEAVNYGTLDNPLTAEQAIALLEGLEDNAVLGHKVFVRGYVTENTSKNSDNQHNIWIENSDGTNGKYFEFYKTLRGDFSSLPTAANGLKNYLVTVTGWATKNVYNGATTYEIGNKNPEGGFENGVIVAAVAGQAPVLTGITIDEAASVKSGNTVSLVASPIPVRAELTGIQWASDNTDVATVTSAGVVTGVAEGTAHITASVNSITSNQCTVTVEQSNPNERTITISPSAFDAVDGGNNGASIGGTTGVFTITAVGTNTADQFRVFKGKTMTVAITGGTITSIEITCTANGTTKQGPGCWGEGAPEGYTFETDGKKGTWVGSAASVDFLAKDNQVRITQFVITYIVSE